MKGFGVLVSVIVPRAVSGGPLGAGKLAVMVTGTDLTPAGKYVGS